jgi:CubicO group peptidase (beta-lactamase class C family)
MKRTTLRPTMAMTWPLAQGHEEKDGAPAVIRPAADNAAGWPAGSIFSSALDLSRFAIAFMNDGRLDGQAVLSPKLIAIMSSPHARVPGSEDRYGYGLTLSTERGVRWVHHDGSRAGYGSRIRMAPEQKFAVVIVANRSGASLPELDKAICEMMLPLQAEAALKLPTHPLDASELRRYGGVYSNGGSKIVVKSDGGALVGSAAGSTARFTQAGDGFLVADAKGAGPLSRLVTVTDASGRVEFVFAGGRAFRRVD